MKWMPIETAPRNGQWVLVNWPYFSKGLHDEVNAPISVMRWVEDEVWTNGDLIADELDITHWMPLPTPPDAASDQGPEPLSEAGPSDVALP